MVGSTHLNLGQGPQNQRTFWKICMVGVGGGRVTKAGGTVGII
jgi:hypothetical protein